MPFHLNLDASHPFFTQFQQFRTWGRERNNLVALRLEVGDEREIEADGLGYRDGTEEFGMIDTHSVYIQFLNLLKMVSSTQYYFSLWKSQDLLKRAINLLAIVLFVFSLSNNPIYLLRQKRDRLIP